MVHLDGWRIKKLVTFRAKKAATIVRGVAAAAAVPLPVSATPVLEPGSLNIIDAVYGAGTTWVNVKHFIDPCIAKGKWVTMNVTNEAFGGDPIFGCPKTLKVTYSVGGAAPITIEVPEGALLSIP